MFLHVGMHKTASTTIQKRLEANNRFAMAVWGYAWEEISEATAQIRRKLFAQPHRSRSLLRSIRRRVRSWFARAS